MGCFFKTSLAIITIFGVRQKEGGWKNGMVEWWSNGMGVNFPKVQKLLESCVSCY